MRHNIDRHLYSQQYCEEFGETVPHCIWHNLPLQTQPVQTPSYSASLPPDSPALIRWLWSGRQPTICLPLLASTLVYSEKQKQIYMPVESVPSNRCCDVSSQRDGYIEAGILKGSLAIRPLPIKNTFYVIYQSQWRYITYILCDLPVTMTAYLSTKGPSKSALTKRHWVVPAENQLLCWCWAHGVFSMCLAVLYLCII